MDGARANGAMGTNVGWERSRTINRNKAKADRFRESTKYLCVFFEKRKLDDSLQLHFWNSILIFFSSVLYIYSDLFLFVIRVWGF